MIVSLLTYKGRVLQMVMDDIIHSIYWNVVDSKPKLMLAQKKIFYAVFSKQINKKTFSNTIHRWIAENFIPKPKGSRVVDHINGNSLDNRIENLRWATVAQNGANQPCRAKSGYKGVRRSVDGKKWTAGITVNNHNEHLGTFVTPQEAHEAYMKRAKQVFGEFARA